MYLNLFLYMQGSLGCWLELCQRHYFLHGLCPSKIMLVIAVRNLHISIFNLYSSDQTLFR